jgi:isopentenyl-diphosphate delta-isomerase
MLNGDATASYEVREVAPTTLVLGNIGAVQARQLSTEAVAELIAQVGADALCVHLNPAMELVQPGGDRDFGGALEAMERLESGISVPVVAKETGCGIGPATAQRLVKAGIRNVDVSGAGGTSWVAVETERASGGGRALGEAFREWGVPTGASVAIARAVRPRFKTIIATGGITTGLDIARALALGAHAAGMARPVLQAFVAGGREGTIRFLEGVEAELRAAMLLVGARDVASLRKAPAVLGPQLRRWMKLAKALRKG